jgi:hypothetical protein
MAINWGVNPPILPFSVSFLVESLRFHGKVRKPWFSLGKKPRTIASGCCGHVWLQEDISHEYLII